MAKIKSKERVIEYSTEFKIKVVKLTENLNVDTVTIAEIMGLHPVMIYRWRQECREGKLIEKPGRRISMTKPTSLYSKSEHKELKRLKKQVDKLQKENDFLKKWDGYLKAQKQKGSDS